MAKEYKIISLNLQKYPTKSSFKKHVDSIIKEKEIKEPHNFVKPLLPEYLKEMHLKSNPFLDIKILKTDKLKRLQLIRKEFDKNKNKDVPTKQKINRGIRNKFNANYEVKNFDYQMSINEFRADMMKIEECEILPGSIIEHTKSIANRDFIITKRKLCLLTLSIQVQKEEILKLDEMIEKQQQYLNEQVEILHRNRIAHQLYLKKVCQSASNAVELVEAATKKKNAIIKKVKTAMFRRSHLNAECLKLEDDFVVLKTYQKFLSKCKKQQENKVCPDRKSLLSKLKIDSLLSEMEKISHGSKSDDNNMHNVGNSQNNFNNSKTSGDALAKISLILNTNFSNTQLFRKYSKNLGADANHIDGVKTGGSKLTKTSKSNTDSLLYDPEQEFEFYRISMLSEIDLSDEDISFMDPQELVDIIFELELNNLSLIENVQEQEVLIDQLTNRLEVVTNEMERKISKIDNHIEAEKKRLVNTEQSIIMVEQSKQFFMDFETLDRYRSFFYMKDLNITTINEFLIYISEQVFSLYQSLFKRNDSLENKPVDMLYKIEYMVDLFYIRLRSFDKDVIISAKKIATEQKLEASRLAEKELLEKMELLKLQKRIELSKIPLIRKCGKRVVFRSEPLKKPVVLDVLDPETLKLKEENDYFFT